MLKTITIGFLTLAFSFFVGASFVSAQTATPSPTETPTPTQAEEEEEDEVPSAAPQTGFGF